VSFLQEVRTRFGYRRGAKVWLPIVVISGHAREPDEAVEIMKLDADDVIQKPYRAAEVRLKVLDALRNSGRDKHDACAETPKGQNGSIVLSIPGRAVKGRAVVSINGKEVQVTDSSLAALLRLLVAHSRGVSVPLHAFAKNAGSAYKIVDRLRTALRGPIENPTEVVMNHRGAYGLDPDVQVGSIAYTWLASHANASVAELSRELAMVNG